MDSGFVLPQKQFYELLQNKGSHKTRHVSNRSGSLALKAADTTALHEWTDRWTDGRDRRTRTREEGRRPASSAAGNAFDAPSPTPTRPGPGTPGKKKCSPAFQNTRHCFHICRVGCDSSPTFISLFCVVAEVLKLCPGAYPGMSEGGHDLWT